MHLPHLPEDHVMCIPHAAGGGTSDAYSSIENLENEVIGSIRV
jgi:hypothetical protein